MTTTRRKDGLGAITVRRLVTLKTLVRKKVVATILQSRRVPLQPKLTNSTRTTRNPSMVDHPDPTNINFPEYYYLSHSHSGSER